MAGPWYSLNLRSKGQRLQDCQVRCRGASAGRYDCMYGSSCVWIGDMQSCSSSAVATPSRHCIAAAAAAAGSSSRRHISQTITDAAGKLAVSQSMTVRARQVFATKDKISK